MFCKNHRAFWSLLILSSIFLLSLLADLIVNDHPLLVKYQDNFSFPIFKTYSEQTFGGDFPTPTNYRDPYIKQQIETHGWMLFPLLPYSFNTVDYNLKTPTPSAPTSKHLLGTDDEGRDIVARILYGLRLSIVPMRQDEEQALRENT